MATLVGMPSPETTKTIEAIERPRSIWRSHPWTMGCLTALLTGSLILSPMYTLHPRVILLDHLGVYTMAFWTAALAWRRALREGPSAFGLLGLGAALAGLHYMPSLLRVPHAVMVGRAVSVLGLLAMGAGFMLWPHRVRLRREQMRNTLDGLAIAVAVFIFAWMTVGAQDGMGRLSRGDLLMLIVQISAALGVMALWLLQEGRMMLPEQAAAKHYVRAALIGLLTHSLLSGLLRATGHYQGLIAHGSELLHQGSIFLLALAALSPASKPGIDSSRQVPSPFRALIPSLVSIAVLLLAAIQVFRPQGGADRTLLALCTSLLGILMLRHGLLILDLERLSHDLEARVEERTEKLENHHREAMTDLRMRIMAGLAAGLAHDLNNILGIIRLRVDLLVETGTASQKEHLRVLDEASERAITMTRRILASSRIQEVTPSVFDFTDWMGERGPLFQALLRSQQRLNLQVADDLQVFMDPQSLDQIFQNLVSNARDAMGPDGTLAIRAEECSGAIRVEIRDDGPGIAPDHLPRLFDPFFTTKPNGTGLGLPTIRNLLLQNRGAIQIKSEVGRGTAFLLDLPAPERLL